MCSESYILLMGKGEGVPIQVQSVVKMWKQRRHCC